MRVLCGQHGITQTIPSESVGTILAETIVDLAGAILMMKRGINQC